MIHLFRPKVGWRELFAVAKVIHSRWLGEGPVAEEFRQRWAKYLNVERVMTLATASDALCLSMELLEVGPGDEVIIPSVHFIAAANAVLRRGATPVFCDVDPHTLNTNIQYLLPHVNPKTKAVLLVHYGGLSCNIRPILNLGLPVVEDAAVAVGSAVGGKACGTIGDIGLWSFDAMKMLSAGAGGAIWCKTPKMADRAESLIRLGVTVQHGIDGTARRWWEYSIGVPGRLSEMNDISAAIALCQLDRLEANLQHRREVCYAYNMGLKGLPLRLPPPISNPNFYWIQAKDGPTRDALAHHLRSKGIYTKMSYYPLHLALNTGQSLPGAEEASERTLLLPLHYALSKKDVKQVIREGRAFYDS